MAYGERDGFYIECPNCDIFYDMDDNDSCPLCAVNEQAIELLEACKAMLAAWDSYEMLAALDIDIQNQVHEAIAKAEGESA